MGQDQESCSKLLSQLQKYKSRKASFDQPYNPKSDTPIIYIDVGLQIFNIDRKANDEIIVSPKRQTIILDSQHNDFDIETLARNMSMKIDNNKNS
ncbi:1374_t:CDS:2 [Cetraspora pellucida]|uniref:1374_t:CDS:1 n=1 Tax=Cetraspora pellucida TaxID=1433469 RepID=A0ACA9KCA8_9GLOM|nr:1374_t:CDS:2 [Cetraspora pellucida]